MAKRRHIPTAAELSSKCPHCGSLIHPSQITRLTLTGVALPALRPGLSHVHEARREHQLKEID